MAPRPSRSIGWARATIESAFGAIRIDWRLGDEDDLAIEVELPFGVRGRLRAPVTERSEVRVDGAIASRGRDAGARGGTPSSVTHARTSP